MADQQQPIFYLPVTLQQLQGKASINPTDVVAIGDASGNLLYKTTIQQLVQMSGVSFSGNIAGIAKSDTVPATATPTSQIVYFGGAATYNMFPGSDGQPIVTTANLNVISWDGTKASVQAVPISVDLSGLIPKADIVNNTTTGGATKVPSADVAKTLYDTTAKIKAIPGKNLANPINFKENTSVTASTGVVIPTTNWMILEVFNLVSGQTYVRSTSSGYGIGIGWVYDINDTPLVSVPAESPNWTMPVGGVTFRVNVANDTGWWAGQKSTYQVEIGSVKTAYAPYSEIIKLVDNNNTDVTVKLIKDGEISGDKSKPNSPATQSDLPVYTYGGGDNLANPADDVAGSYIVTSPGSTQFDINHDGVVAGWKRIGFIKVTPGVQITISGLISSTSKAIQFADINKVKLAVTPGMLITSVPFSFIPPAGCQYITFTKEKPGETVTQLMVNEGSVLPYAPFVDGINGIGNKSLVASALKKDATLNGKQIATTDMIDGANKPIRLLKEGIYFYVRTSFNAVLDLIQKFTTSSTATNKNGSFDFVASYQIDKSVIDSATAYESGIFLTDQTDDVPPFTTTGNGNLGEGHGLLCPVVTSSGHGKTPSDILSKWVDNAAHNFYLVSIIDADTLLFYSEPTSFNGELVTLSSVGGTTLTHVSGATNTGAITVNSQVAVQQYTVCKNQDNKVYADGQLISVDGLFYADEVKVTCKYEVVDPNTLAIVNPFTFNNGDSFVKVAINYIYQANGACVIIPSANFVKQKRLAYWYGLQAVRLSPSTTYPRVFAYVDKVKIKDAKDYLHIVETTTIPALITFLTADLVDPTLPVDRYIQLLADASGNKKVGFAMGINTEIGYGKNVVRAANAEHFQISALGKGYFRLLEDFVGTNQVVNYIGYRYFFDASKLTGDVSYKANSNEYHIIDAHTDNVKLPIAASEGLDITEVETVGTIDFATEVSTADGLLMSNTGYATAIVKL